MLRVLSVEFVTKSEQDRGFPMSETSEKGISAEATKAFIAATSKAKTLF